MNGVSARTGGGVKLLSEQLAAMAARDDIEATAYVLDQVADRLTGTSRAGLELRVLRRRPLLVRLLWEHFVLPVAALRSDVVYNPGNFALFLCPRPQLLILQNMSHFGGQSRAIRRRFFPMTARLRLSLESQVARASVRRATIVAAVSQALTASVKEDMGARRDIHVVRSGAPDPPRPIRREPADYVLAVANDYPHKDWDGLIRAFAQNRDLPRLMIVGEPSDRKRLDRCVEGSDCYQRVEILGRIDDADQLDGLYRGARCVIAHSHLESFGFTPLEALARGVPVAAADLPSHREVCEQAVHYYSATSDVALAQAVRDAVATPGPLCSPEALSRPWSQNIDEIVALLRDAAHKGARSRRRLGLRRLS